MSASTSESRPVEVKVLSEADFDDVTQSSGVVFVDFWASWCGPCVRFAPVYAEAARKFPDVAFCKVSTEEQEDLSSRFEIASIPTLMAFKNGQLAFRASGALDADSLAATIEGVRKLDDAAAAKRNENRALTAKGERPAGVPMGAIWDDEDEEWGEGPVDAKGRRNGMWKFFRADGTRAGEAEYKSNQLDGVFRRYHETGELAAEGRFAEGEAIGTHVFYRASGLSTERQLRAAASVARLENDFEDGSQVASRAFDARGARCLPGSGRPYPSRRPAGVPESAELDESEERFVEAARDDEGYFHGRVRKWNLDGRLFCDQQLDHGVLEGLSLASCEGAFADPNVAYERGIMHEEKAIGVWELLDAGLNPIARRDLGAAIDEETLLASPVMADSSRTPGDWLELASAYEGQGKITEALVATLRACGTASDASKLEPFAARHVLVRTTDGAQTVTQLAGQADRNDAPLDAFFDLFLRGATPSSLLQLIAIRCDRSRPHVSLDLLDAAIALAPAGESGDRSRAIYMRSRTIVLLELARVAEAAKTAERLAALDADSGKLMSQYVRVVYPRFDFWPAGEDLSQAAPADGKQLAQSLDSVRRAVETYATRLDVIREAALARGRGGPSVIPDLTALLPNGRAKLERRKIGRAVVDTSLQGMEQLPLRKLMEAARHEWAGLTWLLWSVGETSLALPSRIAPPESFARGLGHLAARFQRTSGEDGAPSFALEGIAVDDMVQAVHALVHRQYFELSCLSDWLTNAKLVSPWQADLREDDDDEDDDDDDDE